MPIVMRHLNGLLLFALCSCSTHLPSKQPEPLLTAEPAPLPLALPALEAAAKPTEEAPPAAGNSTPGWFGVQLRALPNNQAGVLVIEVLPGSPAQKAGLLSGDVIISLGGVSMGSPSQIVEFVAQSAAGTRLPIGVRRQAELRLFSATLARVPSSQELLELLHLGQPAPLLEALKTVQGSLSPDLRALRGKPVLIEFAAPFCVACAVMSPTLNRWHEKFGARGVATFAVIADSIAMASRAAIDLKLDYPVFSDEAAENTRRYHANLVPTLFLLDQRGSVDRILVGFSSTKLEALEVRIEQLLAEH